MWLDITKAKALLGFHCLTDCDTVEKFTGRSQGTWTQTFLKCEENILNAFTRLPLNITANVFSSLEIFVCKIYSNSDDHTEGDTRRWKLYVQELKKKKKTVSARSKTIFEILPPERYFIQHLCHSHVQAEIFAEADKANIEKIDPAQYGWKMLDNHYAPITTVDPIAPKEIIDIESCNCNGDCSTDHCPCKRPPGRACSHAHVTIVVKTLIPRHHYIDSTMTVMMSWKNRMQHAIHTEMLFVRVLFLKKLTFGPHDAKIGPVTSQK